jgi:UDP-4-amino-4,6-dideoxy-N-acetyl-beta-L-altrosamine transaminase
MESSSIPYSRQSIDESDIASVEQVLRSDFLTQGPEVDRFETAFATYHGARHAVAVSSATAALHLGCVALDVGKNDEVWTTPNSFVASANAARYCGASVGFVDIDARTRNMSASALADRLLECRRAGARLPTVVIPVDFSGLPADLDEIRGLGTEYGFKVLEDASHATGAEYRGRKVGSGTADATVFSLHAVKVITGGEGGVITTESDDIAARLRRYRSHGITRNPDEFHVMDQGAWWYEQQELGWNYRMTDLQAALAGSQLRRLPEMQRSRERLADRYDELLRGLPLTTPPRAEDRRSSWHLYVIELADSCAVDRRAIFEGLRSADVLVNVHYIPIHLQPYYRQMGFRPGMFPTAEAYYNRALSLPLYPDLTDAQQDRVVSVLRALCQRT